MANITIMVRDEHLKKFDITDRIEKEYPDEHWIEYDNKIEEIYFDKHDNEIVIECGSNHECPAVYIAIPLSEFLEKMFKSNLSDELKKFLK